MMVHLPTQISRQGVFDGVRHRSLGGGDVMLEAVAADELEKLLEFGDLDHAVAAKGIELVFGEATLAYVTLDFAANIIGRNAAVRERPGTDAANNCAVGVLLADSAGDDFLVIHALVCTER